MQARNHTWFYSCYNTLLMFCFHFKKSSKASWAKKNDWKLNKHWSFGWNNERGFRLSCRSLRTTNCLSSFTKSNFPSFLLSLLLFYVNFIMYSFQWWNDDGKNFRREELFFFPDRFFFPIHISEKRTIREMKSSCHQRRQQTNNFLFSLSLSRSLY